MELCYCTLHKLQTDIYINYFLNDFIPKHSITEKTQLTTFKQYIIQDVYISKLHQELKSNYNFQYPIESFFIFYHTNDQRIHIDGSKTIYNSSLNLPLLGSSNTKLIFYEPLENYDFDIGTAHYVKNSDLVKKTVLNHSNEWIFLDPAIPHQIVGPTITDPRITLCIRFTGNPKFQKCKKYFM